MNQLTIRTSDSKWLEEAVRAYTQNLSFTFVDDAGVGIDQADLVSAIRLMAAARKKSGFSFRVLAACLASIGVSGLGLYLILLAVADPEPTTKLGILLAGGVVLALSGSYGLLCSLGVKFNVSGKGPGGVEFEVGPA